MLRFPPLCCSCLVAGLVLVLAASAVQAQPKKPDQAKPAAKEPFHQLQLEPPQLVPEAVRPVGASVLFLSGASSHIGPALSGVIPQTDVLFWFYLGDKDRLNYFTLRDTNTVPKVLDSLLQAVKDERAIPDPTTADLELDTYNQMLLNAGQTAVDAFLREARRDVGYAHLMNQPRKYRGDVIFVKGTLRRSGNSMPPGCCRRKECATFTKAGSLSVVRQALPFASCSPSCLPVCPSRRKSFGRRPLPAIS